MCSACAGWSSCRLPFGPKKSTIFPRFGVDMLVNREPHSLHDRRRMRSASPRFIGSAPIDARCRPLNQAGVLGQKEGCIVLTRGDGGRCAGRSADDNKDGVWQSKTAGAQKSGK